MHLHVIWDHLKSSRILQAGFLLIVLSGLAETCDQLGAVDFSSIPGLGSHAPAIIACIGVAKVVFRTLALFITAVRKEPNA